MVEINIIIIRVNIIQEPIDKRGCAVSILFQRNEPAKQKNDNFVWIKVLGNEYEFIGTEPEGITDINRYLIEKGNWKKLISQLNKNSVVYSCISLGQKSQALTKIQLLFLKKQIVSKGWISIKNKQLFLREADTIEVDQIEILEDFNVDSLFLICSEAKKENEILSLIDKIDLLNQPMNLGHYFPTERTLETLIQENIGIAFFQPYYYEEDITANERTVIVYYSPWIEEYF